MSVVYDYCTGWNTFNSVISHTSQGVRQSAAATLCTWEEGSFFGWVYPDKIELDLRGKIAYKIQIMGYDFNVTDVEYSFLDLISSQEIPTVADGSSCNPPNTGNNGDAGGDGWAGGGENPSPAPTPGNPIIIIFGPDPTPTPTPAPTPEPTPTNPQPPGGPEYV
ncbi:hypothetical protein G8759_13630 [Spirosoma aureum]|uniref:Uncharacterized protein n=1 Tax=Spirosoma aureum TaxID=2692134 RepID=A0A6G9AMM2_9BACT|nr:hypothetical protein [Spirosoma aureum]QIP13589.1 hypothetical protein G8759_13630 [Spirosoma aureum]